MSENDRKSSQKSSSASTEQAVTASVDSVQAAWDEANEKGYFGTTPDDTPNEAYTVAGVTKAAKEARDGK